MDLLNDVGGVGGDEAPPQLYGIIIKRFIEISWRPTVEQWENIYKLYLLFKVYEE